MNVLLQSVGGYSVEGLLFITYTRPAVPAEQPPTHIFKLQVQVCCVFFDNVTQCGFLGFFLPLPIPFCFWQREILRFSGCFPILLSCVTEMIFKG